MWLVALSRHKSEFTALVEDKNKLQSYLINNTGNIASAIELEAKSSQNNRQIESKSKKTFTIDKGFVC